MFTPADAPIHYEAAGTGRPPLVLVHGGMCDHRDWDRLVPLLAGHHAVIRLDLRGHGRSTGDPAGCTVPGWAADLLALVDGLGLRRPVLVGHSLASRIVAEAAASRPAAIGGVVLVGGSRSHSGPPRPAPADPPPPPGIDAVIEATIGPHADPQARAAVRARMAGASLETMTACVTAMRDWDLGRADAAFAALADAVPVLAVQSTYHDPATPRHSLTDSAASTPWLDFLRAAVPQLETVVLTHAGHFTMLERPHEVAGLIHDFAQRAARR